MEAELVHLTNEASKKKIEECHILRGKRGIFAVPAHVADESWVWKVVRTGLKAAKTTHSVRIPAVAASRFSRPVPLGPYSAWKFLGEVFFARSGAINLKDGTWQSARTWFGARTIIYALDILTYLCLVTVLLLEGCSVLLSK